MLLREFPRPTYDTGIGFHWYPDYWHYDLRYLDIFAPHLESMGVTWMSLISDLSRSIPAEFLRRLIERGIEPVIRVDSPGVVYHDQDVLRWRCETYRDSGVHYIQIFNEPNLAYEWADWSPHGLAERFMDYLIPALETMHSIDGICPVFTPMAGGGNYWDVDLLRQCLEIINRRGLRHLFGKMAIGIHNYAHNRPLTWGKGGQNLWSCSKPHREEPGCENQLGFHMFEWYDHIVRYQVGVSRPLVSTESGVILGNQANGHFPPIDRTSHAERSREMARMVMEGEVPSYLMNGAYWLLFTQDSNKWAPHRWFRDDGHPVLPDSASAMRSLAKHQRLRLPYIPERLRVLMRDGSVVVMEREEYLKGVVPKEMGTRAHLEALKAQAVAARSYASYAGLHPRHREREADICTTVHCQVWSPQHFPETDQAVKETEGVVGTYRDEIINAFFFGHCDGHTRNSEDVWSARVPYCRSVPCPAPYPDMYGHGVGMCQRGAMAMAQQGAWYGQILTHYYTGIELFDTVKRREIPISEPFPIGEPPEVDPWLPLGSWPRPEGDNRMGIHAGLDLSPGALESDRDRLLDIGIKWVSLALRDHEELDRSLGILGPAGVMAVVRPRARLGEPYDFARVVSKMQARGAPPYVQLYRWPSDEYGDTHEHPPKETFADGWIGAAQQVYEAEGYPGLQVTDPELLRYVIEETRRRGLMYLWSRTWFAPHLYGSNLPPAFPYDPVNQEGQPVQDPSREFVGSVEDVNRWRQEAARPGQTAEQAARGALAFLAFAKVFQEELGRVPPMIATEGGWQFGVLEDRRYPAVDAELHAQYHREMFSWFATGRLSNGDPTPSYLLAVCPWILSGPEADAWYSERLGPREETIAEVRGLARGGAAAGLRRRLVRTVRWKMEVRARPKPRRIAGTLPEDGIKITVADPWGNRAVLVSGSAPEHGVGGFEVPIWASGGFTVRIGGQRFAVPIRENGVFLTFREEPAESRPAPRRLQGGDAVLRPAKVGADPVPGPAVEDRS